MTLWTLLLVVLTIGLLLVAAKAHGRQVRLHRELHGHLRVEFGGENDPFVEALWRRDRIRFWATTGVAAALLVVLFRTVWRLNTGDWLEWLLIVPWAMAPGFLVAGLTVLVASERDATAGPVAAARTQTYRSSRPWTVFWWLLVVAGLTLLALVLAMR
jgi:hypothetical protein